MSQVLHRLWEIMWLLPITLSLSYLWINFTLLDGINKSQFETTLLCTIAFNVMDILWILFDPLSFSNDRILIIGHHLCVILTAFVCNASSNEYQHQLYICLPYIIEINTICRDIFKLCPRDSILYHVSSLLWDITWIPCRVILLPSISIWSLFAIKNYIIPFALLPLSLMNLHWTRFWIKSVRKRYCRNKR